MKKSKATMFKRFLAKYRNWNSQRKMKILNTMTKHNFDQAMYLANRKRDIINHKVWVIAGNGIFLIFARYQMKHLQLNKLLDKHTSALELDQKASYIAYPVSVLDRKRGGRIRRFIDPEKKKSHYNTKRSIITPR